MGLGRKGGETGLKKNRGNTGFFEKKSHDARNGPKNQGTFT